MMTNSWWKMFFLFRANENEEEEEEVEENEYDEKMKIIFTNNM